MSGAGNGRQRSPIMQKKKGGAAGRTPQSGYMHKNPDMKKSVGGILIGQVLKRLPPSFSSGWRLMLVKGLYVVGIGYPTLYIGNKFLNIDPVHIREEEIKYEYVIDKNGRVADMAYRPLHDAALGAKRRTRRYQELEEDREWESNRVKKE